MRTRLLLSLCLVCHFLIAPVLATLEVLPTRIFYPSTTLFSGGQTTGTMNQDADIFGAGVMFPATGTLTDVAITTATIGATDTAVPFQFQTLGNDGNPSGSIYVANAAGTFSFTATTDNNVIKPAQVNGGTGVTVTLGDQAVLRWQRTASTGTLQGSFRLHASPTTTTITGTSNFYDYDVTTPATWTRTAGNPYVMLKIGGVWMVAPSNVGGITSANTTQAFMSDSERGILINTPVSYRAVGMGWMGTATAATTYKGSLYSDHLGTPDLEVASVAIYSDSYNSTGGNRAIFVYFTAPETLTANVDYVAVISPQGAVNFSLTYFPSNPTYAATFPTGSTGIWATRDNVGDAFTTLDTRLPAVVLIVDAIDTGSVRSNMVASVDGKPLGEFVASNWLDNGSIKYKRGLLWGR